MNSLIHQKAFKNPIEIHKSMECMGSSIFGFLRSSHVFTIYTTKVVRTTFQNQGAIGKHRPTSSKPQYSLFLQFPLPDSFFKFPPLGASTLFIIGSSTSFTQAKQFADLCNSIPQLCFSKLESLKNAPRVLLAVASCVCFPTKCHFAYNKSVLMDVPSSFF